MSTDKKLVELEQDIRSMHQPRPSNWQCPCHESAYNEDDFQRIFGAGDEQQLRPRRYDQEQFDHGHTNKDF